jgi:K+-sensing histidine kinase KdpD
MTELVENAIVHSTDPAQVGIDVDRTADGTPRLRVTDDGPGIPDRERELLTGAGETQLEHGLGVGLWFVNWAVSQLGAELEFERADTDGTVVAVSFHGADVSATANSTYAGSDSSDGSETTEGEE